MVHCRWTTVAFAPSFTGRVLIIDNELHPETLANRLYRIASEMQIDADCDAIDVISLRGQNVDINSFEMRLAAIEAGTYTLAIVDALYRTLPNGTSENDNAAMMAIYNRLDYYAAKWDTSIVMVHHSSKGAQGDKSITDVGSGAGSISRAADTHIVIRPHEHKDLAVFECATRSFKSPDPVSIRFQWPIWEAVTTAPQVKQVSRKNVERQAVEDRADMNAILNEIPLSPAKIQQKELRDCFSYGVSKFDRLMRTLKQQKRVEITRTKQGRSPLVFYSKLPVDSGNGSGINTGIA